MQSDPEATVLAMVFDGPDRPLRAVRHPRPVPAPGEVIVAITCCTVCGSDLHTFKGARPTPVPTILGHEIIGRVESVGGDVHDDDGRLLQPGDRVTWSVAASCGSCFFCTRDLPQKCQSLFKYGHQRIDPAGHVFSGGLAGRCHLVAGTTIVSLPDDLPDLVACPANCATATVAAAIRTARLAAGETFVLQGLGALGLTAAAMARSLGAAHVIGCDTDPRRRELAIKFGATQALDPADAAGLQAAVLSVTDGRGADVVIELSGAASAVRQGIDLLRIGGRSVLVGSVSPGPDVQINPESIVRRMLSIQGLHNYTPRDLKTAVQFLARNHMRYPFTRLIDGTWPLVQADAALAHAVAHRSIRVAVVPGIDRD